MPGQTSAHRQKRPCLNYNSLSREKSPSSLITLYSGRSVALSDFRIERVVLLSGKDNTKGIAIEGGVKERQRTNHNTTTFFLVKH
jgi:hypothetical protein